MLLAQLYFVTSVDNDRTANYAEIAAASEASLISAMDEASSARPDIEHFLKSHKAYAAEFGIFGMNALVLVAKYHGKSSPPIFADMMIAQVQTNKTQCLFLRAQICLVYQAIKTIRLSPQKRSLPAISKVHHATSVRTRFPLFRFR